MNDLFCSNHDGMLTREEFVKGLKASVENIELCEFKATQNIQAQLNELSLLFTNIQLK